MDYKNFKSEFEQSGLTQKLFAKQKGISASMVCYYLKKANLEDIPNEVPVFKEVKIQKTMGYLKISLPSGVQIEVPV